MLFIEAFKELWEDCVDDPAMKVGVLMMAFSLIGLMTLAVICMVMIVLTGVGVV